MCPCKKRVSWAKIYNILCFYFLQFLDKFNSIKISNFKILKLFSIFLCEKNFENLTTFFVLVCIENFKVIEI